MKRLVSSFLGIVLSLLLVSNVFATGRQNVIVTGKVQQTTVAVDAVTLDNDPTSVTSAAVPIGGYDKVGIYWDYAETEVGGGVSGALTITGSLDGVNFAAINFFDYAGGATPQSSESLAADGTYFCWLDRDIPLKAIKVIVTGTAVDVDDTILTSVTVFGAMY